MSVTSTVVHRAEIQFREAAACLQAHVGCFWIVTAERNAVLRVVPDGTTAISIQLQSGRSSGWVLRGPLERPDERRFASPATLVGVRLRPGVAFMLSGIPAHATVCRRITLADEASFRELVAPDVVPPTPAQCIETLERFLIARLRHASLHPVVATAIQEIECAHGVARVSEIATRCDVSVAHLNRLMRLWVGHGTKRFANIVRFQATLKEIDHAPMRSGADLASHAGYFDQAHLTLELGRFAGDTPRRLRSSVSDFSKTRCDDAF